MPMIKLNPNEARTPKLAWNRIERMNEYGGELLAAFELLLVICCIIVGLINYYVLVVFKTKYLLCMNL